MGWTTVTKPVPLRRNPVDGGHGGIGKLSTLSTKELWKDFQKGSSTDPSTGKTRGIYSFFRTLSTMLLTRRSFFNSSSIFRQAWRTVVWSFLLNP